MQEAADANDEKYLREFNKMMREQRAFLRSLERKQHAKN